jgi:hypothetical protein
MLVRSDSNSPSQRLPQLFALWVMAARVGQDTRTFVTVTLRRPA